MPTLTLPVVKRNLLLGLIVLVAFALRLPVINWGLPSETHRLSTYHPDESVEYTVMQQWNPRHLDFHPHKAFFWGSLHLYLLAGAVGAAHVIGYVPSGSRAFYESHLAIADRLYRVGRGLSLLLGLLGVLAGFRAGKKLWGEEAGLWTAALAAVTPLQVAAGAYVKIDSLTLLWGFLVIIASSDLREEGRGNPWLSGLLVGLAAATKYTNGLWLTFPLTALVFAREKNVMRWGAVFAGALGGFLIGCPYALLSMPEFLHYLHDMFLRSGSSIVFWPGGYSSWLIGYWGFFFPYGLGWPLLVALAFAAVWGLLQPGKERWLGLNFLLTYGALAHFRFQLSFYTLPMLPAAFLLGARGFTTLAEISSSRAGRIAGRILASGVVAWTLVFCAAYMSLFTGKDSRVEASEWLTANVPAGKTIGIGQSFYWTPPVIRESDGRYHVIDVNAQAVGDVARQAEILKSLKPDYFVLTDCETREYLKRPEIYPTYSAALQDVIGRRYHEVARFERSPKFGPLVFRKGWPPWDWLFPYPTISVYAPAGAPR